jgi:hypothetical protein
VKGGNVRQGGTGGDIPRRRRDGGVAEAAWDSSVPGVGDKLWWSVKVVAGA